MANAARLLVLFLTFFVSFFWKGSSMAADTHKAWDFTFVAIDGSALPLSTYQGKVVLVVNTASQCGFTPQYEGLQALYKRFKDKGLVILAVPSNDFGAQEPGSAAEIKSFCETTFHITFPITDKVSVHGDAVHPFYHWAAQQLGPLAVPRWNFHKYLIAPDGHLADWFSTLVTPEDDKIVHAIEKLLPSVK